MLRIACLIVVLLGLSISSTAAAPTIALHPQNSRYFLFRDTPTVLITSGEHYGAVVNRDFNYIAYLDTISAAGLNMTRIFSGTGLEQSGTTGLNTINPAPGRTITPWARSSTPGYLDGGNKFNLDVFDSAYWSRLRDFVQKASDRGIVVEYVLFTSTYGTDPRISTFNMSPLNAANNINGLASTTGVLWDMSNTRMIAYETAFVRKAVSELNKFDNVTFELCNECYVGGAVSPGNAWHSHMAQVIVDAESVLPNRHLIARNIANGSATTSLQPNISIYNFHYTFPPDSVSLNYGLNRPIAFDENGFRGAGADPYRQEAWAFLLNGGAVYDGLDWSFTVASPTGLSTDFHAPNSAGGATLRSQLRALKNFMGSIDFVNMSRNPGMIVGGLPVSAKAWALSKSNAAAVYLLGGSQADLVLKLPAGSWRADWVNSRTGSIVKTQTFTHGGGNRTIVSPIYSQDIALRLTTTTANPPPTVGITSPANGSTFAAPATITVNANASDSNGTVSSVGFYRNGVLIGTDTTSPYSLTMSSLPAGSYSLTARATDNGGAVTISGAISISVLSPNGALVKAVNVNGPQLTVGGIVFQAESGSGLTVNGGTRAVLASGAVVPTTNVAQTQLLSTVYWNSTGTMNAGLPIANGSYRIYLHTWEDNFPMDFQLAFEGQAMGGTQSTGAGGTWKKIGPYAVTVGDGNLSIRATGGHFMLAGIEVYANP